MAAELYYSLANARASRVHEDRVPERVLFFCLFFGRGLTLCGAQPSESLPTLVASHV